MLNEKKELAGFKKRLFELIDKQFKGAHTALARAAGVPPTTVQGWKDKDAFTPNALYVARIAKVCHVSTDWLLTGQEPGPQEAQPPAPDRPSRPPHDALGDDEDDEEKDLSPEEFWAHLFTELREIAADRMWAGWYQVELMKRFPELVERLKKRMELDRQAELERPEAVGE